MEGSIWCFIGKVRMHPEWPVHNDIFDHPSQHLMFQHPLWTDTALSSLNEAWCDSWESVTVVNQSLVRCDWPYNLATRFWPSSSHMVCIEWFLHWSGLLCHKSTLVGWHRQCQIGLWWMSALWLCSLMVVCIWRLHLADDDTVNWLEWPAIKALAEWKMNGWDLTDMLWRLDVHLLCTCYPVCSTYGICWQLSSSRWV